jgi:hypothetical protein
MEDFDIFEVGTNLGNEDADALGSFWCDETRCIFSILSKTPLSSEKLKLITDKDGIYKYQNEVPARFSEFCNFLSELTGKDVFESGLIDNMIIEKIVR